MSEARGWRRLAWAAYEHLPSSADGLLRLGTRALLPFTNRRLSLGVLRGRTAVGEPASVLFAGPESGATESYVAHRFFAAPPTREHLDAVPIWKLGATLARRRADVDLVVARLDQISARLALGDGYVAVPEWVGALAPVPEDAREFCRRSNSFANNLNRAVRTGLAARVSHDLREFDDFFDRMYVPFTRALHGAEAALSNRARMRRCFRQGGLVFAERAGKASMGALYRTRGSTLDLVVLGTPDGDLTPRRDGASFALELFVFEHARAIGCTHVDFGGSRPSPADGLLVYKARWGSRVMTTRSMFYDLSLCWDRLTPALLAFLATTPLVFRQADGLAGVIAVPDARRDIGPARTALRTLQRVYVLASSGAAIADLGVPTIRVDPAAEPAWRPPYVARPS
jgi:hypothetical protein